MVGAYILYPSYLADFREHEKEVVNLDLYTDFEWYGVTIYNPTTPFKEIYHYDSKEGYIPEDKYLLVFFKDNEVVKEVWHNYKYGVFEIDNVKMPLHKDNAKFEVSEINEIGLVYLIYIGDQQHNNPVEAASPRPLKK